MVAYSFKRRFVVPVARGLGVKYPIAFIETMDDRPKRQTFRENGKRSHAQPGDMVQLYYAQRTKQCFLIGEGRCVKTVPARILTGIDDLVVFLGGKILGPRQMKAFAIADGFRDIADMHEFFKSEHRIKKISGTVIYWEPIK